MRAPDGPQHGIWRDKINNEVLYDNFPRLSTKFRMGRLRMAGHCVRHPELPFSNLMLWTWEYLWGSGKPSGVESLSPTSIKSGGRPVSV